jgi:hypothetical protein
MIAQGAAPIAELLKNIEDPAIFQLLFANYVEHVVITVVGPAAFAAFFQHCFPFRVEANL